MFGSASDKQNIKSRSSVIVDSMRKDELFCAFSNTEPRRLRYLIFRLMIDASETIVKESASSSDEKDDEYDDNQLNLVKCN